MLQTREARELFLLAVAVVSVLAFGTLGFMLIEGWPLFDALYMVVITLSTVGFQEVHPLSDTGRVFTIFLILVGVGVAMVVLPRLAGSVIERQIRWVFGRKHMKDLINSLQGHTIICGYGRLSRFAAQHLRDAKRPLVVIDRSDLRVQEAQDAGHLALHGDATSDEVLLAAGIKRARQLVSLLPKDADNLYVILASKELNPEIFIMSRAEEESGEKRLIKAGASRIMSPYRVSGEKIASGLLRPFVTDFLELAASREEDRLTIEELRIPSDSPLAGRSLLDSQIRKQANVIIAALIKSDGSMTVNPAGEAVLEAGSTIIGLGQRRDLEVLEKMLERSPK